MNKKKVVFGILKYIYYIIIQFLCVLLQCFNEDKIKIRVVPHCWWKNPILNYWSYLLNTCHRDDTSSHNIIPYIEMKMMESCCKKNKTVAQDDIPVEHYPKTSINQ